MLLYRLPEAERKRVAKMKIHEIVSLDPQGPEWTYIIKALPAAAQSELACGNFLIGRKPGEFAEALHGDDPPNLPDVPMPEAALVTPGQSQGLLHRINRALGR